VLRARGGHEAFRTGAKAGKKVRHILGLSQPSAVEIVAPAKGNGPPLPRESMKLEFPEWQEPYVLQKRMFFLAAQKIRLVFKTLRKTVISKKIERPAVAWHAVFSGRRSLRLAVAAITLPELCHHPCLPAAILGKPAADAK
jgi:hypothetical protein